nr:N-acetylmuramoyl-L-alanine amidase [Mycolicibacterium fluoranthenivorans]
MLLSAVVGTVVILPWAVNGVPENPGPPPVVISQQPLGGLGNGDPAGETIREVHQDTPFSMVAITADDLDDTTARVRARQPDGSWGPWYDAEALDGVGPQDKTTHGTEPVFVGRTTTVQIAVRRQPAAPPATHAGLGYIPVNIEKPLPQNVNAVLISPPKAPIDVQFNPPAAAATIPGQPPNIISRAQWGADESMKCGAPIYDQGVRAGVVHHTAGSNDYLPEDSAAIVRSIYEYHARTLGWCDIAYNALVDKYGQVFEGRAGGMDRPVQGAHTGGFNTDTWGVAMLGDFDVVPPTPIQLRTVGRLLGWRLGLDHVDPLGTVTLTSAGGDFTKFAAGAVENLPTIFTHRDVGNTDCPGNAAYALMPVLRDIAARFNRPAGPADLIDTLRGGAIFAKWQAMGADKGPLGMPTSPEAAGNGDARYVTFDRGAMYWSPVSGAQPVTGAIYDAWGALGFERGALGLPTSGEINEPQWIVQNFQHGTLNFDRETGAVTRVTDGVPLKLPTPNHSPIQMERFTPIDPR